MTQQTTGLVMMLTAAMALGILAGWWFTARVLARPAGGAHAAGVVRYGKSGASGPGQGQPPRWRAASPPPAVYADITGPLPAVHHEDDPWDGWGDWDDDTLAGLHGPGEWGRPAAEPETAVTAGDARTLTNLMTLSEHYPEHEAFYQRLALAGA